MAITVPNVVKVTGSGVTTVTSSGVATTTGSTFTVSSTADFGVTINTPTDSKSNVYGALGTSQVDDANSLRLSVFYKENGAGGAGHTATVTYSGSTYPTVYFTEVAGAAVASYDSGSLAAATDNNGTPHDVTSGTFAQANNAVLTWVACDGGGTRAYSCSGFTVTQETDGNNFWTGAFGYKLVTATTAQLASWVDSSTRGLMKIVAFKEAAGGGGPVTAALTGVAGTGGFGTVAPSTSKALTGNAGTGSVGAVSPAASKALTGNAGTSGTGTVSPSVTIALTGNQATGAVGSVSAGSDATAALTGVVGTGSVGSVSPAVSKALTGNAGTGGVGTAVPSTSKGVTGNAGTSSVGSVAPAASAGLTGSAGTGSVGSVGPSVTIALSGVSATGAVGTVAPVTGGVIQALTGVDGTGQAGSVGIDVVIGITGVTGTGLAGDVSLPSTGGGRDDSKTKIRKRVNELNKKILQAEAEEAQEIEQIAVTKAKSVLKSAPTQGFDEDEEEALMLLL